MTQINYQKLASAEGVLDTLGRRQYPVDLFLKQASESGIPAWMGAADDVAYYIYVANNAPGVIKQAQELVYGGQKLASLAGSANQAVLDQAARMSAKISPDGGTKYIAEAAKAPRGVFPEGALPDFSDGRRGAIDAQEALAGLPAGSADAWNAPVFHPNAASSRPDDIFTNARTGYRRGRVADGFSAPLSAVNTSDIGRAGQFGAAIGRHPGYAGAAALTGTAALGAGGYGAYQGLKDDPWYQPALDVLG